MAKTIVCVFICGVWHLPVAAPLPARRKFINFYSNVNRVTCVLYRCVCRYGINENIRTCITLNTHTHTQICISFYILRIVYVNWISPNIWIIKITIWISNIAITWNWFEYLRVQCVCCVRVWECVCEYCSSISSSCAI